MVWANMPNLINSPSLDILRGQGFNVRFARQEDTYRVSVQGAGSAISATLLGIQHFLDDTVSAGVDYANYVFLGDNNLNNNDNNNGNGGGHAAVGNGWEQNFEDDDPSHHVQIRNESGGTGRIQSLANRRNRTNNTASSKRRR